MDLKEFYEVEREFHNKTADRLNPRLSRPDYFWRTEEKAIWKLLGNLRGKKILDLGCLCGKDSVRFALRGGEVTGIDISEKAVLKARDFSNRVGVEIDFRPGNAESLDGVKDDYFDIVYLGSTLHHLPRVRVGLEECKRVLKPGGLIIAVEPLAGNPFVELNRKVVNPEERTPTEHPFLRGELEAAFRRVFGSYRSRYMYFLSPASYFFRVILRSDYLYKLSFRFLHTVDRILGMVLRKPYPWMVIIWARK